MTVRTCKACGATSDAVKFYKSITSMCAACWKAHVSAHRLQHIESVREYDRKRGSLPHRIEARKEYQETHLTNEMRYAYSKKYHDRFPERRAARIAFGNALRDGKIAKPECCEECGSRSDLLHGHHDDYGKPLDVRWLCPSCHGALHRERGDFRIKVAPTIVGETELSLPVDG